jgi:hypothetical protein
MALEITVITDSISALEVSGVKICDLDQIPEAVDVRQPTIFPNPVNFVSNITQTRMSYGGASEKMNIEYDLTYRLCYAPIGTERGLFAGYPAMVAAAYRFLDAVLDVAVMTGLEDITLGSITNFGPVTDMAGNGFHGTDIVLHVLEFADD